jgi:chaperone required for assembly of F1-ATPase
MSERDFLASFDAPAAGDPLLAARSALRKSLPRRFYADVTLIDAGSEFAIALDGHRLKSPGGQPVHVADRRIAEAMIREWLAQDSVIDPAGMPMTRLVNTALDQVDGRQAEVIADIQRFARSDLLCYRADEPVALAERQARLWDPILAWAAERFEARLAIGAGIVYVPQPEGAVAAIAAALVIETDPLVLAGLHVATTLTGSCLLALALRYDFRDADAVWQAAHLDEDFQIETWGADCEAEARRTARRRDFDAAALVLMSLRPAP